MCLEETKDGRYFLSELGTCNKNVTMSTKIQHINI